MLIIYTGAILTVAPTDMRRRSMVRARTTLDGSVLALHSTACKTLCYFNLMQWLVK